MFLTLFRFIARSALSLRVPLGVCPAWGMSVAQGGSSAAPGLSQLREALRWPAVVSGFQGMFISVRHYSLCTATPSAGAACWMFAWGDPMDTNLSRHKKCRRIAASLSQACSPAFACPWQLSLYPPKPPNSRMYLKALAFCCVLREYLKLRIYCSVRVVPEL